jgi:hypothetical protein
VSLGLDLIQAQEPSQSTSSAIHSCSPRCPRSQPGKGTAPISARITSQWLLPQWFKSQQRAHLGSLPIIAPRPAGQGLSSTSSRFPLSANEAPQRLLGGINVCMRPSRCIPIVLPIFDLFCKQSALLPQFAGTPLQSLHCLNKILWALLASSRPQESISICAIFCEWPLSYCTSSDMSMRSSFLLSPASSSTEWALFTILLHLFFGILSLIFLQLPLWLCLISGPRFQRFLSGGCALVLPSFLLLRHPLAAMATLSSRTLKPSRPHSTSKKAILITFSYPLSWASCSHLSLTSRCFILQVCHSHLSAFWIVWLCL